MEMEMEHKKSYEVFLSSESEEYESAAESEPGLFAVSFDSRMKEELQRVWPFVESALEKHKIACELDLDESEMVFDTSANKDPAVTYMARGLFRILAAKVPPWRALRVADGVPFEIFPMGCRPGHLCQRRGIKEDVYLCRKQLLLSTLPVKVLEEVSGCEIYLCPEQDVICYLGPRGWLSVIRKLIRGCILHGVSPAPIVMAMHKIHLEGTDHVMERLEALRLEPASNESLRV